MNPKIESEYSSGTKYLRNTPLELRTYEAEHQAEQNVARYLLIELYAKRIAELEAGANPYDYLDRGEREVMAGEVERAVVKGD